MKVCCYRRPVGDGVVWRGFFLVYIISAIGRCWASDHTIMFARTFRAWTTRSSEYAFISLHERSTTRRQGAGPSFPYSATCRAHCSVRNVMTPNTKNSHHRNSTANATTNVIAPTSSIASSTSSSHLRKELLREKLVLLGMDADGLEAAVQQTMEDSSAGYDGRFGRSAIRTCQSFYYPKKEIVQDDVQLKAAAERTARQVQFLWKRHQSHEAEWVRHHDTHDAAKGKRFPLILLLDNLRSAYNVGSLFRTADAAGCCEVVTVGITPHPFGNGADKLRKSALGAELTVPSKHFVTITAALEYLQKGMEYQLVGMETTANSVHYTSFSYNASKGVILILGNEITGVDTTVMDSLDGIVEIPMYGTKNSLNVAACAPIVLYEIIRQWNSASHTT